MALRLSMTAPYHGDPSGKEPATHPHRRRTDLRSVQPLPLRRALPDLQRQHDAGQTPVRPQTLRR